MWGIKPKNSYTEVHKKKVSHKEEYQPYTHTNDYNNNSHDRYHVERDTRFDPIDNQIPEKKLPWFIRTGWIIVIGLFTEGLYWIIGPIIRILWKKNH